MSREILRLTREATFGVRNPAPGVNDVLLLDLQQDNAYTVQPVNERWVIRSSAASNMTVMTGSAQTNLTGRLMTYLRPSNAPFLVPLATQIGTGDCRELPSFTADYGTLAEDGACAFIREAHLGCKFGSFALSCDSSPQGSLVSVSLDVTAQRNEALTAAAFPTPSLLDYDGDRPFVIQDTENRILLNGVARDPSSLSIEIRNTLMPYRGNKRFISKLGWRGRETTVTMRNLLMSRADRNDYEATAEKTLVVSFSDGVTILTFNFGPKNIYSTPPARDVKMGDFNYETVTLMNMISETTGEDFTATIGPVVVAAPPQATPSFAPQERVYKGYREPATAQGQIGVSRPYDLPSDAKTVVWREEEASEDGDSEPDQENHSDAVHVGDEVTAS